jgi:hypothetical protein
MFRRREYIMTYKQYINSDFYVMWCLHWNCLPSTSSSAIEFEICYTYETVNSLVFNVHDGRRLKPEPPPPTFVSLCTKRSEGWSWLQLPHKAKVALSKQISLHIAPTHAQNSVTRRADGADKLFVVNHKPNFCLFLGKQERMILRLYFVFGFPL